MEFFGGIGHRVRRESRVRRGPLPSLRLRHRYSSFVFPFVSPPFLVLRQATTPITFKMRPSSLLRATHYKPMIKFLGPRKNIQHRECFRIFATCCNVVSISSIGMNVRGMDCEVTKHVGDGGGRCEMGLAGRV